MIIQTNISDWKREVNKIKEVKSVKPLQRIKELDKEVDHDHDQVDDHDHDQVDDHDDHDDKPLQRIKKFHF